MVYPGSGNHYLGMGRDLALRFPGIIERDGPGHRPIENPVPALEPDALAASWQPGWEADAISRLKC
jgi:hypothetical protein